MRDPALLDLDDTYRVELPPREFVVTGIIEMKPFDDTTQPTVAADAYGAAELTSASSVGSRHAVRSHSANPVLCIARS